MSRPERIFSGFFKRNPDENSLFSVVFVNELYIIERCIHQASSHSWSKDSPLTDRIFVSIH